jgi:hypothetical protein
MSTDTISAVPLSSSTPSAQNSFAMTAADIDFFNIGQNLLAIEIKVTNASDSPSAPDTLELLAAPFGAFVPWRSLARIVLPVLAPRKVQFVRWRAVVPQAKPLGSPDRIGPRDLLVALGLGDEPPDKPSSKEPDNAGQPAAPTAPPPAGTMPPGLMDLLLQETPHWAGNINVLVGKTDVERHRARALRVYPGRLNMAWFVVGAGGDPDAYAFRLQGLASQWDAKLFDMTSRATLTISADDNGGIVPDEWIETHGSRTILLALRVPEKCEAASVAVHVTQKSTQRKAVVEFSLDPKADGRGCYSV